MGRAPRTTLHGARSLSPALGGRRPSPLVEVRPQGKMVQHNGIGHELVLALDVPVLQMVEQPVEVVSFFRNSLPLVAEQVIEVPKFALPDGFLLRSFPLEPQLAEQLVEVPTEPAYIEQIVDNPVPHTRRRRPLRGLQGSHPRQRTVEQTVDIPVPFGHGRPLHGFRPGQVPTASLLPEPDVEFVVPAPWVILPPVPVFLTSASCALIARACG